MKANILAIILFVIIFGCKEKETEHKNIIQQFLNYSIETDGSSQISLSHLQQKGIISLSNQNIESQKTEANKMYGLIIQTIGEQLRDCDSLKQGYEILSVSESKDKKQYDENIQASEDESIYVLYCGNNIITHFLIKENKISSFSTMNKGSMKIFLQL